MFARVRLGKAGAWAQRSQFCGTREEKRVSMGSATPQGVHQIFVTSYMRARSMRNSEHSLHGDQKLDVRNFLQDRPPPPLPWQKILVTRMSTCDLFCFDFGGKTGT